MNTQCWRQCLFVITLLSIAGYILVILSGFWHVLALLVAAGAVAWIWRMSWKWKR